MRFNEPIPARNALASEAGGVPEEEKKEEETKPSVPKIWQKINRRHILFVLVSLVVVASIVLAVNFYLKAQKLQSEVQATSVNETQKTLAEVGKLIVLPKDEEPTVATISDVEKLRDQPFFANAKNGDKVIIYRNAHKAILYDPIQKIIVEVAPLNN